MRRAGSVVGVQAVLTSVSIPRGAMRRAGNVFEALASVPVRGRP